MTDSATPATNNVSREAVLVIAQLEDFRMKNPEATEYVITSELQAAVLLLMVAGALQRMLPEVKDPDDKAVLRAQANEYRKNVNQGNAYNYVAAMDEENQLSIYELRIVTQPSVVH